VPNVAANEQPQTGNTAESQIQPDLVFAKDIKIMEQKNRELIAAYAILENWIDFYAQSPVLIPPRPAPWPSPQTLQAVMEAERALAAAGETDAVIHAFLLETAKARLKAMSGYVLPLLYGLLGAAAYVLRSLSKEISDVTFSNVSHVRFILRLVLGMLSGISVGLVLTPEALPTTLSSVTPLALAFLAGYSVELVFSAMDRLISAFSSEGPRSPAK
jgi:hypothetical protein